MIIWTITSLCIWPWPHFVGEEVGVTGEEEELDEAAGGEMQTTR